MRETRSSNTNADEAGVAQARTSTSTGGNDVNIPWDGELSEDVTIGRYPIPEERKLGYISTAALIGNNMIGVHLTIMLRSYEYLELWLTQARHRHFLYPNHHLVGDK
jgi:hypothetical protein